MRPLVTFILTPGLLIAVSIPAPRAAECTPPFFDPGIAYTSGPGPTRMVTGDFNHDGFMDVAVAHANPGSVGILLGTGLRTFAPSVLYPMPEAAFDVVSGDFNGDHITDLIAATRWTLSVLIGGGSGGVGDGTFTLLLSFAALAPSFQIAVADFNQDDILDIVMVSDLSAEVRVFQGLGSGGVGNGTFGAPAAFTIGTISTGVVCADFNLDGKTDWAATNSVALGTVFVAIGQGIDPIGPSSFVAVAHYPAGVSPFDVETGDFNNDGIPDLVVASGLGGVVVLKGEGHAFFTRMSTFSAGNAISAVPCDVNQDGITDLAVADFTGTGAGSIRVRLGQGSGGVGSGSFGDELSYSVAGPYQLRSADMDGDGAVDLMATSYGHGYISLVPGTCGVTTAVQVALFEVEAEAGGVRIRWRFGDDVPEESWIERSEGGEGGPWSRVAAGAVEESGVAVVRDTRVEPGRSYQYRLAWRTGIGELAHSTASTVMLPIPRRAFELGSISPNPTNESARITFTLPREAPIEIAIVDLAGRRVALVARGLHTAGTHAVPWSGRDVAPGVYFVRYSTPEGVSSRRLLLSR